MSNDLEDLFNRQPPLSEEDLSKIISHMRQQRANFEAGVKATKSSAPKGKSVDLAGMGLVTPKVVGKITFK